MNPLLIFGVALLYRVGIDVRNKILLNRLKKLPKPEPIGVVNPDVVFSKLKPITYEHCIVYQDGTRILEFEKASYARFFKIDETEKRKFETLYPCQHYTEALLIALYAYMPGCIAGSCDINTQKANHRSLIFYADGEWFFYEPQVDSIFSLPKDWHIYRVNITEKSVKAMA